MDNTISLRIIWVWSLSEWLRSMLLQMCNETEHHFSVLNKLPSASSNLVPTTDALILYTFANYGQNHGQNCGTKDFGFQAPPATRSQWRIQYYSKGNGDSFTLMPAMPKWRHPNYGYFPELWKSLTVVPPHNVEHDKVEFPIFNSQVEPSACYLGSFIVEATERDCWIANKSRWLGVHH